MKNPFFNRNGFSLAEVVVVMALLAIVSTVIFSKSKRSEVDLETQAQSLKAHLRQAQSQAMSGNDASGVCGIKCDTNFYWLFKGANPDSNIIKLFDDPQFDINHDNKLSLTAKKITISTPFTVFFDQRGIPYSTYTDKTVNTPLTSDLTISVKPYGASSPTESIIITPYTGFMP